MIRFSKDSWHGKILNYLSPYRVENVDTVCQLVRRLLITVFIIWPLVLGVLTAFFSWMAIALWMDVRILFGLSHWGDGKAWWYGGTTAFNITAIVLGGIIIASQFHAWNENRLAYKLPKRKSPGLVKTYLSAVKDKVCPLVRYE